MDVAEMLAWADPAVTRIVTLAPELPGALDAVRALRAAGIVVSAGHSAATFEQAQVAFAAGVGWGTHLYNAMSPLQHREPGLMGALLTGSTPFGLIPDGIHSHPAMLRLAWLARGRDGIVLVTDCMAAMGMDPGTYALGEHTVTVALEGATGIATARLEDGTLAGSVLRMDEGLRCMTAFSGCSAADALMMASANPARLLGLEHKGRIAPGCDADLVLLSPDLRVTHTFVAGRLAFQAA
jgi:N-acetylglucosamine-6-phosphate deacetylase